MTRPTDEELDALVEYLRGKGFILQREADAIAARILAANARADRAEAALAASQPADPVTNAGCCQAAEAERDDLRAKLAEVQAERDAVAEARDMMGRLWDQEKTRADRAEAALAASQPADPVTNAGCCQAVKVKPLVWEDFGDWGAKAIAMLYRLWVEGDHVHGLPPVSAAIAAYENGGDHE